MQKDDVIYRQAAIEALESIGSLDTDADREYARGIFNALPSAQPEIVFCKQCKYFEDADEDFGDAWCYAWGNTTAGDQFCSCGENIKDE